MGVNTDAVQKKTKNRAIGRNEVSRLLETPSFMDTLSHVLAQSPLCKRLQEICFVRPTVLHCKLSFCIQKCWIFLCCPSTVLQKERKWKNIKVWERTNKEEKMIQEWWRRPDMGKQASGESVNRINKELFDPHTRLKMVLRLRSAPIGQKGLLGPEPYSQDCALRWSKSAMRRLMWASLLCRYSQRCFSS